jgi:hypothetical protein
MGRGGNLINYRIGLVERIGVDQVLELEKFQPVKKYKIPELKAIRDDYKARLKPAASSVGSDPRINRDDG